MMTSANSTELKEPCKIELKIKINNDRYTINAYVMILYETDFEIGILKRNFKRRKEDLFKGNVYLYKNNVTNRIPNIFFYLYYFIRFFFMY